MKTVECYHCKEQVTKRQSLFVPKHNVRVCRKHTEFFEEIRLEKQRAQDDIDRFNKAQQEEKARLEFERQKDHMVRRIRCVAHEKNMPFDQIKDNLIKELAGQGLSEDAIHFNLVVIEETVNLARELGPLDEVSHQTSCLLAFLDLKQRTGV